MVGAELRKVWLPLGRTASGGSMCLQCWKRSACTLFPKPTQTAGGSEVSWVCWVLSMSQLPASLYEEVKAVAVPLLMLHHTGSSHRAAKGIAHIYLLEVLLTCVVARWSGQLKSLHLGRLLLVAGILNIIGLFAMGISVSLTNLGLQTFLCGQVACAVACCVREFTFPLLTMCFPEEQIGQLAAHRRALMHLGALLGGCMVAAELLRTYLLLQALGMLISLGLVILILPCIAQLDLAQTAHVKASGSSSALSACKGFGVLVAARFFQSLSFVSASTTVMLCLIRTHMAPPALGPWTAVGLLAAASTLGHLTGLATNLMLGRQKAAHFMRPLTLSCAASAASLLCFVAVGTPGQYLAVALVSRAARSLNKVTSEVVVLREAKRLGRAERAAGLAARRAAFRAGQLAGKYGIVPVLALQDQELALWLILTSGAAAAILGGMLQIYVVRQRHVAPALDSTGAHRV